MLKLISCPPHIPSNKETETPTKVVTGMYRQAINDQRSHQRRPSWTTKPRSRTDYDEAKVIPPVNAFGRDLRRRVERCTPNLTQRRELGQILWLWDLYVGMGLEMVDAEGVLIPKPMIREVFPERGVVVWFCLDRFTVGDVR